MPDPFLLPSIAMLSGGGFLAARDYLRRRLEGPEDRYMALYGKKEWEASNMDLAIHSAPELVQDMKRVFLERLEQKLATEPEKTRLLREEATIDGDRLSFRERPQISLSELTSPRKGIYVDLTSNERIRVVWNHMQTDGVGMWNALRDLFDPNPPLIGYRAAPSPPPFMPELLALPSVAQRLVWRGRLRKSAPNAPLTRGLAIWETSAIRNYKNQVRGSFNLLTSAVVIHEVFTRHADRDRLNVGLTAYFPFLEGRNKYAVFLCKVKRAPLSGIVDQLHRQTKNQVINWGRSAAQAYALGRIPDPMFARVVSYYRRQIDVLVSSLPVGRKPITLNGMQAVISCHPWELTLPYYFLLVGTRSQLHVSYTSRYPQDDTFLDLTAALSS
ncbi:MAG: hypothetical protein HC923_03360 [Myxococcales bacterium]|nr:hypothetical protein [Myxococcales bacterium]